MQADWAGIFPAVTTKFKEDHSLDITAMEKHLAAQIEAGVHGLVLFGTLGELGSITHEEKLEIIKTGVAVSAERVPVLATVGHITTAEACEFVKEAAEHGVDGFMVLPSILYPSDRRETLYHFREIAKASPLPIMIYNNPVSYGVNITPKMFAELAEDPTFVAIKESSGDVRRVTDIINAVGDRYQIFLGVDDLAFEGMMLGAVGWVAGLVNAFPEETVAIFELVQQGRFEEAREIYRWFTPLLKLDVSTKLVQNIKLAEAMTGLGTEPVRPPRLPLAGEQRERVKAVILQGLETRPSVDAVSM